MNYELNKIIGNIIKEKRIALNITQRDLGLKLGYDLSLIHI